MAKLASIFFIAILFMVGCSNHDDKSQTASNEGSVEIHNKTSLFGENKENSNIDEVIKVKKMPEKAIVMDYGALDIFKELGLESKVVGLPKGEGEKQLPNFLKEFSGSKYKNTGDFKEINFDEVAKSKPDVIFVSKRIATSKNLDELKKAAPNTPVVLMGTDDRNFLKSMKENTDKIGEIYNKTKETDNLNDKLDKKIKEFKRNYHAETQKTMFLLLNEAEISTYGKGGRFGNLVFDTLGFKPADNDIKGGNRGQIVTNEYINKQNPDIILALDRNSALSKKSNIAKVLNNKVAESLKARKNDNIIELDAELWNFGYGSTATTIKQIEDIEKNLK